MKPVFVHQLENVQTALTRFEELKDRGAGEACLIAWEGPPGVGKTRTGVWWASQFGALLLRARQNWTPTRFWRDLLEALGCPMQGGDPFNQLLGELGRYQVALKQKGKVATVIIDEADSMLNYPKGRLLESVRDVSDFLEIPVIMIGMERFKAGINRFPQVNRRVYRTVDFKRGTENDTKNLVAGLCEVSVKDDLLTALHAAADGYVSETLDGIKAIERFARRNGGGPVGVVEMAGQELLKSRQTGDPVKVGV